jgi:hypothetical protein
VDFLYLQFCCASYILLSLLLWIFAGYAYFVNDRRSPDDPEKKKFNFSAIFLAPITWPLLLIAMCGLFVLRAFLFGAFLVLFALALVTLRKPFIVIWLDKIATQIGNRLLKANTVLIELMQGKYPIYDESI